MQYNERIDRLLTTSERNVFASLRTPELIQDYLDKLPINFSYSDEDTCRSPRRMLKDKRAYCFEGAVFAAAALAYQGQRPLLIDLRTTDDDRDEDHVVAPFTVDGLWGAISKTNYPVLRWRDPVYKTIRELVMSYFHEYYLSKDGSKTLVAYSKPFSLARYKPELWVTAENSLDWLAEALDDSPHYPIAPQKALKKTRAASAFERKATDAREWKK